MTIRFLQSIAVVLSVGNPSHYSTVPRAHQPRLHVRGSWGSPVPSDFVHPRLIISILGGGPHFGRLEKARWS
jgi:hypothetical protein